MSVEKDRMKNPDGLVDQGWAQMHQILDREMPERKRRGLIWWMLAGVIFISAGSVVGYQLSKRNEVNFVPLDRVINVPVEIRDEGQVVQSKQVPKEGKLDLLVEEQVTESSTMPPLQRNTESQIADIPERETNDNELIQKVVKKATQVEDLALSGLEPFEHKPSYDCIRTRKHTGRKD